MRQCKCKLLSYVRGAPPSVASGSLSMVYRCACRYMTGTPGICAQTPGMSSQGQPPKELLLARVLTVRTKQARISSTPGKYQAKLAHRHFPDSHGVMQQLARFFPKHPIPHKTRCKGRRHPRAAALR